MTSDMLRAAAKAIEGQRGALAETSVADDYARRATYLQRYGPGGRDRSLQDAAYHLAFLADAVGTGCPSLLTDYVGWAKVFLTQHGIPAEDLAENLRCMQSSLKQLLPAELAEVASAYVDAALQQLPQLPVEPPTLMEPTAPLAQLATAYLEALTSRGPADRQPFGSRRCSVGHAGKGHLSASVSMQSI